MQLPLMLRAILRCAPRPLRSEMISVIEEFLERESPSFPARMREYASLVFAVMGMKWRRSSSMVMGLFAAVSILMALSLHLSSGMSHPSHSDASSIARDPAVNGRSVALASKIQGVMESHAPRTFAGIAISPSNSVEVFVKVGSTQAARRTIFQSIPESTTLVHLHGVQRSLAELETLQAETQNSLRNFHQVSVTIASTWIDIQSNQVIIGIQADSLKALTLPSGLASNPAVRITRNNSVISY